MFGFKVDTKGLSRAFQKLGSDFVRKQKIAFQAAAYEVQGAAKARAPKDKGQLVASIKTRLHVRGSEVWSEVGTNVKHAVYTELGNAPRDGSGVIRPKVAKMLAFQVGRGSKAPWVFAKSVKPIKVGTAQSPVRNWRAKRERGGSGGMQTMPWLQRASYVKRERVLRIIRDGATKALTDAGKRR
ncbi:MAG TPA: HK97 gp10 family phage protein [Phycisphaerae bacterium]|nr:HK97 gp10 family phage protein [Phycisphaerae bacterium]